MVSAVPAGSAYRSLLSVNSAGIAKMKMKMKKKMTKVKTRVWR